MRTLGHSEVSNLPKVLQLEMIVPGFDPGTLAPEDVLATIMLFSA